MDKCSIVSSNPRSAKVFQNVPLNYWLPRFGKHFIPMLNFHWSTLGAKQHLTNALVTTESIVVHDAYFKTRLSNVFIRKNKHERLVKNWIQRLLNDCRFAFFNLFSVTQQPNFDIWIYKAQKRHILK